jgi:predicted amidophosphoribosyltransferase
MPTSSLRACAAALLDLVLPGSCGGCGAPGPGWCGACAAVLGPPLWPRPPGCPPVVAVGRYRGPLRTAVLAYKERGRRDLAGPLALLLASALVEVLVEVSDVGECWLVPAPSRPAAARARGGDHVVRLCRRLARGDPRLHVAPALRLGRRAHDSVGLDAAQRAANLAGRLRVRPAGLPPPGSPVVVVDDVVTTGATLRTCRAALAHERCEVAAAVVLADATAGATARHTRAPATKTPHCRTCPDRGHSSPRSVAGL